LCPNTVDTVVSWTGSLPSDGTRIDIIRNAAGEVTITLGAPSVVNSSAGFRLRALYSTATLIKLSGNNWILTGDLRE
jgi:hypothetical protein